ncbi:shikimate kinase [Legionella hackeliae]|uniref:Phosphoribulokinase/uridine kinase domain-containing protein n=1 Tax=Legionella hackeliae TaxID=449 RepID=A0A0A8UT18_LEGHA|nr:AAA family ATPase [Legionella hackeliae]KTD12589.1 uridine kinase [Legionella hackeliae]CEK12005.1 conserved protein of unknown function [Legionella hackeliae]STX48787.1 Uridine monophosphokinase [Legionella hackeliae]
MKVNVLAISGISGAGKTTLAKALAKQLKATCLHLDEFDETSTAPEDYLRWYEEGENYAQWDYATLAQTLQTLKTGEIVIHPASKSLLKPTRYIIFDAPLGYLHQQTGKFIDTCIHLELPLDVSLARRTIRDFKQNGKSKEELLAELDFYLHYSRKLFCDKNLKESADLIIDGLFDTALQVQTINDYLGLSR